MAARPLLTCVGILCGMNILMITFYNQTTSLSSIQINNLIPIPISRMTYILFVQLLALSAVATAMPKFTLLDYRQITWPLAEKQNDPSRPYTEIDCFTEMDESFVGENNIYRLKNEKKDRSCLVRIPTRTLLTINPVSIHSNKTYARILAGSAIVFMPLASAKIYKNDIDNYGPWHIPCEYSYLVFATKSNVEEVIEFTISPEREEDKNDPNEEYCNADGTNYVTNF